MRKDNSSDGSALDLKPPTHLSRREAFEVALGLVGLAAVSNTSGSKISGSKI